MYIEMEKAVADILRQAVDEKKIAGASVLLVKDGKTVFSVQEGMADRERDQPMRDDTIFRLHSMTKPVLAAAALRLVEQGKLGLEDALADYFHKYENMKVAESDKAAAGSGMISENLQDASGMGMPDCEGNKKNLCLQAARHPIRIYHLLNMTSGLVYPDSETAAGREMDKAFGEITGRLRSDHPFTTQEAADRFASCPLAFEPGRGWAYGVSADVLGAVMEKAVDLPLADLLRKEILEPLGMEDTAFGVPDAKRDRLAAVYEEICEEAPSYESRRDERSQAITAISGEAGNGNRKQVNGKQASRGSNRLVRHEANEMGLACDAPYDPPFASGGAGLCGTLADYRKFAEMLLNRGKTADAGMFCSGVGSGCQLLQPESAAFLTKSSLTRVQQPYFDRVAMFSLGRYTYGGLLRKCLRGDVSPKIARQGEYGWGGQDGTDFAVFPAENAVLLIGMQKVNARMYSLGKKLRGAVLKHL